MSGIAAFANQEILALEQVVYALEIPNLIKLVTLGTGYQTSHAFSPEWQMMTPEERGKTSYEFRKANVEHFDCTKKLTKTDGSNPIILLAYNPITIPLPLGDDETYQQLKQRIEQLVLLEAKHIINNAFHPSPVNAYHVGEVRLEYRIPNDVARTIVGCMPIAGDGVLSRQASELLQPHWTFNLTYFNIEQ